MNLPSMLIGFWPFVQLSACLMIVLRLLSFRRGTSRHRPGIAWLAWIVIVMCITTAVELVYGNRPPPAPLEVLHTLTLAMLVLMHRGNIAHLLRVPFVWLTWTWRRDA